MNEKCPECGGSVNVDSLCTWVPCADGGFEPDIDHDFQPDDLDSAHCSDDECGWWGTYGDLV